MNPQRPALWWSIPASLFAADALAWGLYPHVYFAQLRVWAVPLLTHAAAEWAMDRHIAQHLFRPPAMLLQADDWLVEYVAARFDCTPAASRRAIRQLAGAEALLRHSRLPGMLHGMGRLLDRKLAARFDYHIQEVACRLPQINRVFDGETPAWLADCSPVAVARERITAHAPERGGVPDAAAGGNCSGWKRLWSCSRRRKDSAQSINAMPATAVPSSAPTSTSLT